jgi:hypothetical protein
MILGIRTIEAAFPGFEAYFADGQVFDLSEAMSKYDNRTDDHVDFAKDIGRNYFDILVPPARKMYITGPSKVSMETRRSLDSGEPEGPGTHGEIYSEFAVTAERRGNSIWIDRLYIFDWRKRINHRIAKRYYGVEIAKHIDGQVMVSHQGREKDRDMPPALAALDIFGVPGKNSWEKTWKTVSDVGVLRRLMDLDYQVRTEDLRDFITTYTIALFYLNVRNIIVRKEAVRKVRNYYWPRNWGREYKVLSLNRTLTERTPGAPSLPTGMKYRMHFCRGHFKRRKTGVYWWNQQWRGDASIGVVVKDYRFRKEEG